MRDLGTPLAPTYGGGKKLLKKSGKKYYKSMVAVDEGRFKKEQKLRKKAFKLEARGAKKQSRNLSTPLASSSSFNKVTGADLEEMYK